MVIGYIRNNNTYTCIGPKYIATAKLQTFSLPQ